MNIVIIDYGMGNIGSVRKAFEDLGASVTVANHPEQIWGSGRLVLPGVGSFTSAVNILRPNGWIDAINSQVREQNTPILGICLGMQLLADYGDEGGLSQGLGLVPGNVRHLSNMGCKCRIPHVGWNDIRVLNKGSILKQIPDNTDFYFVHSYGFNVADRSHVTAVVEYGTEIVAAVENGNVFGTQFHPEKSSVAGRMILKNFMDFGTC